MSGGWIGIAGVIVGAVPIVVLWVIVLAKRVPRKARVPLALLAFANAWAVCSVMMRLEYPKWATAAGGGAIFISVLVLVAVAQMSLPNDTGGGEEESDGGGGGTRPPDSPTDRGGPAEPTWWPQFERELASYLADRERAERRSRSLTRNCH